MESHHFMGPVHQAEHNAPNAAILKLKPVTFVRKENMNMIYTYIQTKKVRCGVQNEYEIKQKDGSHTAGLLNIQCHKVVTFQADCCSSSD